MSVYSDNPGFGRAEAAALRAPEPIELTPAEENDLRDRLEQLAERELTSNDEPFFFWLEETETGRRCALNTALAAAYWPSYTNTGKFSTWKESHEQRTAKLDKAVEEMRQAWYEYRIDSFPQHVLDDAVWAIIEARE